MSILELPTIQKLDWSRGIFKMLSGIKITPIAKI